MYYTWYDEIFLVCILFSPIKIVFKNEMFQKVCCNYLY